MSAIVALWHEELLLHLVFPFAPGVAVIVSPDAAANAYAAAMTRLGFIALRGDGHRTLRVAAGMLSRPGGVVAVAVDGPWGPARVAKPGVALLARLSGTPIIPFHCVVRHAARTRTWDATRWPYPFDDLAFRAGEPLGGGPHDAIDETTALVQSQLDLLARDAS